MPERNWDMYWDLHWSGNTAPQLKERLRPHTPEQLVAEGLHALLCRWNHTDGCTWLYYGWEDIDTAYWEKSSRQKYLKKAQAVLEEVDEKTALRLITTLLKHTEENHGK